MLRSHGCGELDRGLQNLDSLPAREGFFVILFVSNKKYVKVFKGFNWVCANLLFGCADSRFAEPRISFWEGFNFVSAKPPLRRAESRFAEPRNFSKGFNWVCANLLFGCADSRVAKPRNSLRGNGLVLFAACKKYRKNTPRVATLWTPGDDSKLCRRRF